MDNLLKNLRTQILSAAPAPFRVAANVVKQFNQPRFQTTRPNAPKMVAPKPIQMPKITLPKLQMPQPGSLQRSQQGFKLDLPKLGSQAINSPLGKTIANSKMPIPIAPQSVNQYLPTIGQYVKGQITTPYNQLANMKNSPTDRAIGGLQLGFNATPIGTAYNVGTGIVAGGLKGIREGKDLKKTISKSVANPSDIGGTGLGQSGIAALGIDLLAGNPKAAINQLKNLKNAKGLIGVGKNQKDIERQLFESADEFRNVIGRWEQQFGSQVMPKGVDRMDVNLASDIQNAWKKLKGANVKSPSMDRMIGDIKDAYSGINTQLDMASKGIKLGITGMEDMSSASKVKAGAQATSPLLTPQAGEEAASLLKSGQSNSKTAQKQLLQIANKGSQVSEPQPYDDIIAQARKTIGETKQKPGKNLSETASSLYTDWVDRFHPITKLSKIAEDTVKGQKAQLRPEANPRYLLKRFLGMGGIAQQRFDSEFKPILSQIDNLGIDKTDVDAYLKARRDIGFGSVGRNITGSDPVQAAKVAAAYEAKHPELQQVADQLYSYQAQGFDELVKAGFLNADQAATIKRLNPDYAPFERVMDEVDNYLGMPSQTVQQATSPLKKLKGSERQILSPIESMIANTFKQRAAIEKNNVAKAIVDLQKIADVGITPLRTAENVNKRIDIYSQVKDLRPLQNATERLLKTRGRWQRSLESELNKLNQQGLYTSLRQRFTENPVIRSSIDQSTKINKRVIDIGTDKFYAPELGSKIKLKQKYAVPTRGEFKDIINNLVNLPSSEINAIKSKIATRENKLGPILDEIALLSDQAAGIKEVRAGLLDEARLLKDANTRGKSTITVWRDGVKEIHEVGDEIARSVKGMNEEQSNTLLKILSAPSSLLRQGATGRNPDFMIPNVVRDQFEAAINSKYGYVPVVDYLRGIVHVAKNDDLYQQWKMSGAAQSFDTLSGRKQIKELFNEQTGKKNLVKWIIGKGGAALDKMGKYSEEPTRVGLFAKGMQKTGNPLLAAMESRESTLDFARMGAKMKVANSIIPFLNVGVQGLDKLIRTGKSDPKKLMIAAGLYGAAPSTMTTLYNTFYHPEEYKEVPQYVKDSNYVLVNGRNEDGTVSYVTIPKANSVQLIANPIENFISYVADTNSTSLSQMVTQFISSALPVVGDGSSLNEVALKTIGQNTPQAAKPLTENLLNKSFFKYNTKTDESKEIVPYYLKDKPASEQTQKFTPAVYQKVGQALNVSPLQVQNLAEGYLAGFTKIPVNLVDTMLALGRGEDVDTNKLPLLRRFMQTTYPSSGSGAVDVTPKEPVKGLFGQNVEASTTKNGKVPLKIKYTTEAGGTTTIDIGKVKELPSGNKYDEASKKAKSYGVAGQIMDAPISKEEKEKYLKEVGISYNEANYYNIAQMDNNEKSSFVTKQLDALQNKNVTQKEFLTYLENLRKSVNGSRIASDGVVDNLVTDGYIPKDVGAQLKKLKPEKAGGGYKAKKAKKPKQIKYKMYKEKPIKLKKIKPLKFKAMKSPKLKIGKRKKVK